MEFEEQYISGIATPILIPKRYKIIGVVNGKVFYTDQETGKTLEDEPLFIHNESKIFLRSWKGQFPNDSVIVLLLNQQNNIYVHQRSPAKKWEPNKIDLASIAGQRRAILYNDKFENEDINETALREINEETFILIERLKQKNIYQLGTHYNPHTKEYQEIFVFNIDLSLQELNRNIEQNKSEEVTQWFEQGYEQTMEEYFGDKVEKYAGGAQMRPVNFISNPTIRTRLDDLIKSRKF